MYLNKDIKGLLEQAVSEDWLIFSKPGHEQDIEICEYLVEQGLLKKDKDYYKIDRSGYDFLESKLNYGDWIKQSRTAKEFRPLKNHLKIALWIAGALIVTALAWLLTHWDYGI